MIAIKRGMIDYAGNAGANLLFRWAEVYARQELGADFPLLRQFDDPAVALFLKQMALLDDRQKRLLMRGLLGRSHYYAVEALHEPACPEQVQLVEKLPRAGTMAFMTGEWRDLHPTIGTRLPKRQLRDRVLLFLGERLGVRTKYDAPGFLRFAAPVGTATVVTLICIGGRGTGTLCTAKKSGVVMERELQRAYPLFTGWESRAVPSLGGRWVKLMLTEHCMHCAMGAGIPSAAPGLLAP